MHEQQDNHQPDIMLSDGTNVELKSNKEAIEDMDFYADPDWDGTFVPKHSKDEMHKLNKRIRNRRRNKLAKASRKKNRKK